MSGSAILSALMLSHGSSAKFSSSFSVDCAKVVIDQYLKYGGITAQIVIGQ